MSHPVPKELKGEERLFSIPMIDLHFNKKGALYNGIACIISGITLKFVNVYLFVAIFLLLNVAAYPLGHFRLPQKQFEGGNVKYDIYLLRMMKYKKKRNVYLRRRGK